MAHKIVKSASALVVMDDASPEYLHLTIGGPEVGWVVVSNEEWSPTDASTAALSLVEAVKALIALNDPRVNSILEERNITFREPKETTSNPPTR